MSDGNASNSGTRLSLLLLHSSRASRDRLLKLIRRLDEQYIPRISERVDLAEYANKLNAHAVNVLARSGAEDIGFISFYANDQGLRRAYISSIGVDAAHRGRGVANELLAEAERIAVERGMEHMLLEVDESNGRAIRFYGQHGFFRVRQPWDGAVHSALYMEKRLISTPERTQERGMPSK